MRQRQFEVDSKWDIRRYNLNYAKVYPLSIHVEKSRSIHNFIMNIYTALTEHFFRKQAGEFVCTCGGNHHN